ncbi:MAG: transposase [Clostridia bacterium]|nr:transposase [Clostridia bacterium]
MGRIYRERHDIPIPPGAHINHNDKRVFLIDSADGKRLTIGEATSDTFMFPNDTFKKMYPEIWNAEYSKYNDPAGDYMKVGMYGLCLGAAQAYGLYDTLLEAYDPMSANAIMDFSMYSILTRKNIAQLYYSKMKEEIVFSDKVYDDSWWSEFFKEKIKESQHADFRKTWLKRCQEKGIRKIWLCIDGSNNDCQIRKSNYAEPEKNKSHTKKTVVGYIWAVNAEDGLPITYHITPGGQIDAQSIQWLINYLSGYEFEIAGVILDRGFADHEVLKLLNKLKIPYVIMLTKCYGHNMILKECGDTLFWNPEYLINGKDLYGISRKEQIWKKHSDIGFINLYYSSKKGHYRGTDFNNNVTKVKEKAEKACELGEMPVIPKEYKDILTVEKKADGSFCLKCDFHKWMELLKGEGFFSILSSEDFGPEATYNIYALRMNSEVQFSTTKSPEGYDITRVHSDESMKSKLLIGFITNILLHGIRKACQANDLDTQPIVRKMEHIKLLLLSNGKMKFVPDIRKDVKLVFEYYGLSDANFEIMVQEINKRYSGDIHRPVREFPKIVKPESNRRGRKPGSKNKKTLEKEKAESEAKARGDIIEKEVKKRGRRPGTKDSRPRKKRSDAGKKRGPYKERDSA